MARFTFDPTRLNYTIQQSGKEYNLRLLQRSQANFTTLLNLLPSSYVSAVQGPNYTIALKAVAVELSRIELALEDVNFDFSFVNPQKYNPALPAQATTRSDFLYSIIGYLVLVNGQLPPLQWDDATFRQFLISLIRIYFQGSIPKSMKDVVDLFYSGNVTVTEDFLLVRQHAAGYDISDEFTFQIDILAPPGGGFPPDVFADDSATRIVLDLVRPAHTLFKIRYIFTDHYIPNDVFHIVLDAMRMSLGAYYYEDFRSYWVGIRNRDRLGKKTNMSVTGEDHSKDF
jgi:hypothetical protein